MKGRFKMGINWKVRIKNKAFWLAMIPAVLLLIQQIASLFGLSMDFSNIQNQLVSIIGTVFSILAILGVIVDPTTKGLTDSDQVLTYTEPKEK